MEKKLTPEELNAQIKAENERFWAMTPEQKRVAIAADVLASVKASTTIPRQGIWVHGSGGSPLFYNDNTARDTQLQTVMKTTTCDACAVGAAFISAVKLFDKITCDEAIDRSHYEDEYEVESLSDTLVWDYLKQFFTFEQLQLMEVCFEHGKGAENIELYDYVREMERALEIPAGEFKDQYLKDVEAMEPQMRALMFGLNAGEEPAARLNAIMVNIIQNNGTFIPPECELPKNREELEELQKKFPWVDIYY